MQSVQFSPHSRSHDSARRQYLVSTLLATTVARTECGTEYGTVIGSDRDPSYQLHSDHHSADGHTPRLVQSDDQANTRTDPCDCDEHTHDHTLGNANWNTLGDAYTGTL